MTTPDIDARLDDLGGQLKYAAEQIALLALAAIARRAREALPTVAEVELSWSDSGEWLSADGFYDAAGERIGTVEQEHDLFNDLSRYCSELDVINQGTWEAFMMDDSRRHHEDEQYRLRVDHALTISLPAVETVNFHGAELVWCPADADAPHSDTFAVEALGLSILVRRRADDSYVHIDTVHVHEDAVLPLVVEVDGGGERTYETSTGPAAGPRTYTDPDVLAIGVRDGWADPETDPTRIDWPARQAAAAIPFEVVDGRPVNPCEQTAVRYGRNELGHWGEQLAADALVSAIDLNHKWIVMVERGDGHGWALPGGYVDPGETPPAAAVRELQEETGLVLPGAVWHATPPRYVPDPRASDEAWMVTVLCTTDLGVPDRFPKVVGNDDAARAKWVLADTYDALVAYLADKYGGRVFAAHVDMLRGALGGS